MAKTNPASSTGSSGCAPENDGPGRRLKRQLKDGPALVGGMVTEYARPSLAKLYAQAGLDFLYVEYEHGFFDLPALADMVLCARDNHLPVIAKTPQLERAEVAKLLECGVVGIQLPRTETRAEVEALRSYLKFPPRGTRAVAPGYGNSSYAAPSDWRAWMDQQDEETTLVVHLG
ncbi:MAG: aldolase/citrate lyase family protein, partial [Candidatus Latescibacterota bacterium]